MNLNPKIEQHKPTGNALEIHKAAYLELVNDVSMLFSLNAARLDQQIIPGKEAELDELQKVLRKPIINGLSYSDFTAQFATRLTDPLISKSVITQIYNFLVYIEPRLVIFKNDSVWVKRFTDVRRKYTELVTP